MTDHERPHIERLIRVTEKWLSGNYPSKCSYTAHTRKEDEERVKAWKEKLRLA